MRVVALLPVAIVAATLTACSSTSNGDLQRANAAGEAAGAAKAAASASAAAQQAAKDAAQASLQAEVDALKSAVATPPPATAAPAPAAPKATTTSCGNNVSAGGSTSCSFALNVADAWRYYGNGTSNVTAYSPVTQEEITMHCVAGVPVVCQGGRAAVVYIR